MKHEEFFEVLSDIDENIVAEAKEEKNASYPTIVTAPKKKFKPIYAAAAACVLLAAGIIAVFAVNSLNLSNAVLPSDTNSGIEENTPPIANNDSGYKTKLSIVSKTSFNPQRELYAYTGDYSKLEMNYYSYPTEIDYFSNPEEAEKENKFKTYDQLAEYSNLVVVGTFVEDSRQIADTSTSSITEEVKPPIMSYNTFKVEKVLKGNKLVYEGDEITIGMPYNVYDWDDASDEGRFYSCTHLTPMIKGDSWVLFLGKTPDYPYNNFDFSNSPIIFQIPDSEEGVYYPVHDYEGRYPVPGKENKPFEYVENNNGVVSPFIFNEGIYNELMLKIDEYNLNNSTDGTKRPSVEVGYKKVIDIPKELGIKDSYPDKICVEFAPEEFGGIAFRYEYGAIYVSKTGDFSDSEHLVGDIVAFVDLNSTYLCDLNNDGKREICTVISFGSGFASSLIYVCDYANDKVYVLSDRGKYDYYLAEPEENEGTLSYLRSDFDARYLDPKEYTTGVLTLDIMEEWSDDEDAPQAEGTEPAENTDETEPTEPNVQEKVTMTFVSADLEKGSYDFELVNNTEKDYTYGMGFDLEQLVDGQWVKIEPPDGMVVEAVKMNLSAGGTDVFTARVGNYFGKLSEGKYRIKLGLFSSNEERLIEEHIVYGEFDVD